MPTAARRMVRFSWSVRARMGFLLDELRGRICPGGRRSRQRLFRRRVGSDLLAECLWFFNVHRGGGSGYHGEGLTSRSRFKLSADPEDDLLPLLCGILLLNDHG